MLNLKKALCAAAVGAAVAAAAVAAPAAAQSGPAVREVRADQNGYGGDVGIAVGGSQILRFAQPVGRIMIGDPEVGDVIPLTDHTVYVLGKKAGSTSLTVMSGGRSGAPIATFDLRVGYDVNGLQRMIADVVPGEPIQVRAGGEGVILSGSVSSSAAAGRAAMLAEQFAPGKVVNLMTVRAAEQVMLSVRVAEVQRSVVKQLGMSTDVMWENGDDLGRLLSGVIDPVTGTIGLNPDAFGGLGASIASGDWTVDMIFDALERSGVSTTLAEPTLVALSGETANFFAGGEFPIPVVQNSGGDTLRTTIEWKTYGVSVGFTPTVVGDTINLAVAPEVSALDRENALTIQGFRVPAITARKARTTVELRDGQSFAIAGLIRRDFNDSLRGMPGVSKVPIFGALMRSTSFQNNETEVIIIVTVNRANPTTLDRLKSPIEGFRAPSEPELFINGTTEKPQAAIEPQGDPIGEIISTASLD